MTAHFPSRYRHRHRHQQRCRLSIKALQCREKDKISNSLKPSYVLTLTL